MPIAINGTGGGGGGTVTNFSFTNGDGFTGIVTNANSTPNLSLTISDARITSSLLTGFVGGVNSAILATDTIIQAFDKTQGQIDALGSALSFGLDNQIPFTNATTDDFDYSAGFSFNGSVLTVAGDGTGQIGALNITRGDSVNQYIVLKESAASLGSAYLTFAGSNPGAMAMGALYTAGVPTSYVFTNTGGAPMLSIEEATGNITATGSFGITGTRISKGWFTDVESTNMYTVGGVSLSSIFSTASGTIDQIAFFSGSSALSSAATFKRNASAGIEIGTGTFVGTRNLEVIGSGGVGFQSQVFISDVGATNVGSFTGRTGSGNFGNVFGNGQFEFTSAALSGVIYGTTNATPFGIGTNNAVRIWVDSSGNVGVGGIDPANLLSVNALTTAQSLFQVAISTGSAANKGVVVQGVASQSGSLIEVQDSSGTLLSSIGPNGTIGIGTSHTATSIVTMNVTYSNASGSTRYGNNITLDHTATSLTAGIVGLNILAQNSATGTGAVGLGGYTLITRAQSTKNFTVNAFIGGSIQMASSAAQTGTINTAFGHKILAPDFLGSVPTSIYGYTVQNQGVSGATTSAALLIEAQSGSTTNHGILSAATILINTPLTPMGYTTGAGGTVTQATNKSTGVTLNTVTGQITMNNATLNADTSVSFTLTNSAVGAGDYVSVQHISGGTVGSYTVCAIATAGSVSITVRNITAGNLGEAIVLKYILFRAATT